MRRLVTAVTPLLAILILAGTMPARYTGIDLASHFMGQYAAAAAVLLVMAVLFKSPRPVMGLLLLVFCLSAFQLSAFLPFGATAADGKTLKILQANVLFLNNDPQRLKALIAAENPDIVVTAETPPAFAAMFTGIRKEYPWQDIHAQKGNARGLGVISKLPLEEAALSRLDTDGVPSQRFSVQFNKNKIHFLSVHPYTPIENITRRDNEFRLIAEKFAQLTGENIVILGDFNATPYCAAYKQLVDTLGLRNARDGFGIYPTWPVFLPTPFLRIPIDHVLVSAGIAVHNFRTGADIGSDHLPTITEISLKGKQ